MKDILTTLPSTDAERKEALIRLLASGSVRLTFRKVDDTIRTMNATLMEGLAIKPESKSDKPRKENPSVLPVFDMDIQEWRSLRVANLEGVEVEGD